MNDERAGCEVSEALMLPVAEHSDGSDEVEAGKHIDDADEIARHGLKEGELAAGLLNYADFEEFFAGGLSVPEGFKESEVSPVHEEVEEDEACDEPLFSATRERTGHGFWRGGSDEHENENEDAISSDLNGRVGKDGEKAAAESGDREADGDLFGGVDRKLVSTCVRTEQLWHDGL